MRTMQNALAGVAIMSTSMPMTLPAVAQTQQQIEAFAYNNPCNTYNLKGDYDRAIADCTEAIQLDPKYAFAYNNRGLVYNAKDDHDRAIADYTEAIRLDPKYALAYKNRARVNLYAGALPEAMADLNQARELDPKDAYAALWLDIVNKRSNLPSRLAEATKQIEMTKWPAPVIRLYLGQLTPEAVLAAADDPDLSTKKN
jgi:lipoprotein NlpI